jgi:hypothetical protein
MIQHPAVLMIHGIIQCANGIMDQTEFRRSGSMCSLGGRCFKPAFVVIKGVVLP